MSAEHANLLQAITVTNHVKAGGHFPDANVSQIRLPEHGESLAKDVEACVEEDLVHGYIKKDLFLDDDEDSP